MDWAGQQLVFEAAKELGSQPRGCLLERLLEEGVGLDMASRLITDLLLAAVDTVSMYMRGILHYVSKENLKHR